MRHIVLGPVFVRAVCRLVFCFVLGLRSLQCFADRVPVPPAGVDGPAWSIDPFDFYPVPPVTSSRYQQVYSASAFSSFGERGGWITGFFWVSEPAVSERWGATLPSTEIALNITPVEPDHLSTNFVENGGTDFTIVFPRGPLRLQGGGGGIAVTVEFSRPFFYNPSAGNLLLEIRNFEPSCCWGQPGQSVGALDAYDVVGDEVSRVYAYDVDAPSGYADTLGLTTYFVVAPKLTVSIQSTNLIVRWPRDLGQFRLQQTAVLNPGAQWEPADNNVTIDEAGNIIVTLPLGSGGSSRFFRLVAQPLSSSGVGAPIGNVVSKH